MVLTKVSRNLHTLELNREESRLAILSDLHWDNPKCDRDMLKRHLDYCLKESIPVMIVGDLFCLMQGKGDRRGNKSDIRPEHNNAKYLDSIVETAVEWFSPYASILTVIGYGNHETAIIKYQETDLLQRFVDLMNYKNKSNIFTGGYGGWMVIKKEVKSNTLITKLLKYYHGSGGGGLVTRGAINLTRALEIYESMDVFVMGHIHENSSRNDVRDAVQYNPGKRTYELIQKEIHLAITGTYKEEYVDGFGGWHVERGAPIKPLGGRILTLTGKISYKGDSEGYNVLIDSHKFPL
jgi:Icc-related predicted phosphoesterase